MEYKDIRQLAELMKEFEMNALELSEGDSTLRLERSGRQTAVPVSAACPPETAARQEEPAADSSMSPAADSYTITAPMIGVFYAAPAPEMKPYVSIGDKVRVGDVLCIIEAMKMMNEITAEANGVVTEICVGNKQIVEYGHPLFRIRREEPATEASEV